MAASRSADGICNRLVVGASIWGAFLICMLNPMQVLAGRNGNGALIVHTNDAVNYSAGADYCTDFFDNPGSCEDAITRTDKDEDTPAVIWVLAAFHPDSSPAVTAVQFGIIDNVLAENWIGWGPCGPSLEIASVGWPQTGKSTSIAYTATRNTQLFPVYHFVLYGTAGPPSTFLGSGPFVVGQSDASFADESSPPQLDSILQFGAVRWFRDGYNQCPGSLRQSIYSTNLNASEIRRHSRAPMRSV
jgi:hypothetical protein